MQIIDIDSIDDERVAAYTNLTELQLRNRLEPQKGIFIAESPKVIDRALAAGREPLSLLVERPWLEGMADTFAFIDAHWGPDGVRGFPRPVAPTHRLPAAPWRARRDAPLAVAVRGRGHYARKAHRGVGEHRGPHQCGCHHAFRCGP